MHSGILKKWNEIQNRANFMNFEPVRLWRDVIDAQTYFDLQII